MYDLACNTCHRQMRDVLEPITAPPHACSCGGRFERVWLQAPAVIGDECDVWVKNGICNEDGTPRHYRSKAEMRRVAKEKGLVNVVEHLGTKGGDRSPHTQRFI